MARLLALVPLVLGGGLVGLVLLYVGVELFGPGKMPSNEMSAASNLKQLGTAQCLFYEGDKDGDGAPDFGTLAEVSASTLVDAVLGTGTKQGYLYACQVTPDGRGFLATAAPAAPGRTGRRWFAIDGRGVVHESWERAFTLDDSGLVAEGHGAPMENVAPAPTVWPAAEYEAARKRARSAR